MNTIRTAAFLLATAALSGAIAGEGDAAAAKSGPTASQDAVYRALSVRHPEPSCAEVEALSPTPVQDLLYVVDTATQPPWAGMRAAGCLVAGHAEAVRPQLRAWAVGRDTRGFALLLFGKLDDMPLSVATEVATEGLKGPWADDARSRIVKAQSSEIRRLAE